ncbi:MAG: hypothetical protein A2020_06575 [Lentisphaerae bacterium GWF2_45_14]|nr:MAG: hypothetical protein A2020_06575 [Lentisphaerae bacterium GWF2_45_14]
MTFPTAMITALAISYIIISAMLVFYVLRGLRGKKANQKNMELLEEQKFKMAEASLKLLEQREELEDQKLKLAEANIQLMESNEIIEKERQISEKLLLNILPHKVADELKKNGCAKPESFENVSVMFSDIVNFTRISENMHPEALIGELNEIFTAFDRIVKSCGCERIKTIGDAYMCVSGMPEKNDSHAVNIINAAVKIMKYLKERNTNSTIKWEIRAGIHSGRVVGGVVGIEKYIYDVFGDTINTASRIESSSEPMKINISEETFKLASGHFNLTARPPLELKGKGLVKMYFVEYR